MNHISTAKIPSLTVIPPTFGFQVPFLRTWFAENDVDAFSVSLWYKRLGGSDALYGALVNNEDCLQNPGFSLRAKEGAMLLSKIRTDMNEETLSGAI